jgi:hypothetical protein
LTGKCRVSVRDINISNESWPCNEGSLWEVYTLAGHISPRDINVFMCHVKTGEIGLWIGTFISQKYIISFAIVEICNNRTSEGLMPLT